MAKLGEMSTLMRQFGRTDFADAAEEAASQINRMLADVSRLHKQAQAKGPERGTELKASGDTVKIDGSSFPVVLPAKIEAKDEHGEIISCDHPDLE
ncbi:hypothetical protein R0J87_19440, partial [Halomonas sp. SIMBA_159]